MSVGVGSWDVRFVGIIMGYSLGVGIWSIALCVSIVSYASFVRGSGYGVSEGVLAFSGDISAPGLVIPDINIILFSKVSATSLVKRFLVVSGLGCIVLNDTLSSSNC